MLEAALEGLLFVVGDDGLTLDQITNILEIDKQEAKELVITLQKRYESSNFGIRIKFLGNSFKLTTKEEHKVYYEKLLNSDENTGLSHAALETLAIIAYNEPITRITVDDLRGVSTSQIIRKLVAKGLIKEMGRAETPGRPILYETTHEFLDYFNLSTKEDLPKLNPEIIDDSEGDLFQSKYQEVIDNTEVLN